MRKGEMREGEMREREREGREVWILNPYNNGWIGKGLNKEENEVKRRRGGQGKEDEGDKENEWK